MRSCKKLTRIDFLKRSGLIAGGFTFLPHSVLVAAGESSENEEVSIRQLAGYQIIVPDQSSPVEQQAAEKLQHYVKELVHADPVLKKEGDYRSGPAFFIGQTGYATARKIDFKQLKEDGFAWYPAEKNLMIAGGAGKGVLYGVYGLLDLWGFRMYTSRSIEVPKVDSVGIPKKALVVVPGVQYRTTSYRDTNDPEYGEFHRLSSRNEWGLFVHTFNTLVSPDQYGKTHPEYFSLVNGKRLPGTQLCLSNSEVLTVLIANLKDKMAAKTGAIYWSVSQNDNDQHCRCEPCAQLNAKYGGVPSGSILDFVNKVAKAFPDKIISTLAYWYSRTPPQNIRFVRKNHGLIRARAVCQVSDRARVRGSGRCGIRRIFS